MVGKRGVLRELLPREQPDHRSAGVEEGNRLAGGAKFSRKAERFIKGNAGAHIANAERDDGKARGWWRFASHATPSSSLRADGGHVAEPVIGRAFARPGGSQ